MPAFETKDREPATGDDVIVCQHIANQCECGPLHCQFENPPSKVLTGQGNYLRANWSACCQSCFATASGQSEKIAFQTVVKWDDSYKVGTKPSQHEPMKTMESPFVSPRPEAETGVEENLPNRPEPKDLKKRK